jgi:hypothetical protein
MATHIYIGRLATLRRTALLLIVAESEEHARQLVNEQSYRFVGSEYGPVLSDLEQVNISDALQWLVREFHKRPVEMHYTIIGFVANMSKEELARYGNQLKEHIECGSWLIEQFSL